MKMPTRFSLALLISAGALSVALSAPAVFAEDGHGGHGGRGSDDVVTTVAPANDNDVNDDHGMDAALTTIAGTQAVADAHDNDTVDDND